MDIEIVGRHALLFDDDTTAAFVNSQDALVEWNSLLIDRYDVRHLLDNPPPSRRRRNPQTSHSSSADAEIDYERYLDLPQPSEEEEPDAKPEPASGFNAVPFSYGSNEESNDQKNDEAVPEVPTFHPPFPVPDSLIQNLPPTEKVHQIISRTALFVSKNGGQSEIVLRVKQGDNPTFGFLMPDHHLHPYFRFLVNNKDLLQSNEVKTSNTGALSLLGSVYGEDDDGEPHQTSSSGKDEIASKNPVPVKEDVPIIKKNSFSNAMKVGQNSVSKNPVSGVRASSLPPLPKTEQMVLEPSSDMKKLVDKIVEFIIKNGRQFEGVLMEQDRGHGRFPFIIPSNIFHPYYLKVLQKAQEPKATIKEDYKGHGKNKKTSRETENSSMESDDIPFDSDKKEKFKMVINNKSKKEGSDPPSKSTEEQIGVQVDTAQAAAILQAATRGIKPPNLGFLNGKFIGQESNLTDEQKLKAERLKRAKMFVANLKSGTAPSRCVSAEPQISIDTSEKKIIKSEKEKMDEEKRAKRKYRSRSSKDDDIDDNDDDDDDVIDDDDERERKRSHRHHKKKHRSHESEERHEKRHRSHRTSHKDDDVDKKEHRSSHKYDDVEKKEHRTSNKYDDVDEKEERDHKRKKKHRSSTSDDEEDEHSRRKRRSHHSSDEEGESDDKHSRRKHRSHKSSSHRHKHHKRSRSSRRREKDDEKGLNLGRENLEDGHGVSTSFQEQRPKSVEVTEVPDELRAKIRAMLMSTM